MKLQKNSFEESKKSYHEYFNSIEEKVQGVCEKEYFRIYLKDKADRNLYHKLVESKSAIEGEIEGQKQKNLDYHRVILDEIAQLQRIKAYYQNLYKKSQTTLISHQTQITHRNKENQKVFSEIKNTWDKLNITKLNHKSSTISKLPTMKSTLVRNTTNQYNKYQSERQKNVQRYLSHQRHNLNIIRLFINFVKKNINSTAQSNHPFFTSKLYIALENQFQCKTKLIKRISQILDD